MSKNKEPKDADAPKSNHQKKDMSAWIEAGKKNLAKRQQKGQKCTNEDAFYSGNDKYREEIVKPAHKKKLTLEQRIREAKEKALNKAFDDWEDGTIEDPIALMKNNIVELKEAIDSGEVPDTQRKGYMDLLVKATTEYNKMTLGNVGNVAPEEEKEEIEELTRAQLEKRIASLENKADAKVINPVMDALSKDK